MRLCYPAKLTMDTTLSREAAQNLYDEVPYPTGAFEQSHPSRLATLATLFGMSPPPVETCRVLELGCGSGGNILPMALALPKATFVGIDYSAREIEEGKPWITRLGLQNIELRHEDILDFKIEPQSFDYILAHGVFSWVPRPVQDRLLDICGRALSPSGVAYVSYSVYPGCYVRKIARDMMRFHARGASSPKERAASARGMLAFAAGSVPPNNPLYAGVLKGELERISKMSDEVLFHDDLAEINEPLYFYQFLERASERGLKFLSEALFADMQDQMYPESTRAALRRSGDMIAAEQYRDFLSCRSFRQTLLCRESASIDRLLTPAHVKGMYIASNSAPVSPNPDVRGGDPEKFKNPTGIVAGMELPLAKAAMVHLAEGAPRLFSFDELLRAAIARSAPEGDLAAASRAPTAADEEALGEAMVWAYSGNMVDLSVSPGRFVADPGDRPRASAMARLQAASGKHITSLTHKNIIIDDPFALEALRRLDGERDRAALVDELADLVASGVVSLSNDAGTEVAAEPRPSVEEARPRVAEKLAQTLQRMARFGLLC